MINIVTEGAVDPKFLTSTDVESMRLDIPVKNAKIDELMVLLAGKMGTDEKVPYENIDNVVQVDAAAGISGISNVESFADSHSQQGAPSIWIVKKLLAQTKASPSRKVQGKPLTADVTFTSADFNIYDAATIRAKFSTLPTPTVIMKMGTQTSFQASGSEMPRQGHVLVDTYFRTSDNTWFGFYRPITAILHDGTEQVVAYT